MCREIKEIYKFVSQVVGTVKNKPWKVIIKKL